MEAAREGLYAAAVAVCLTGWQNGGGEAALQPLLHCKDLPLAVVLDSIMQVSRDIVLVALKPMCVAVILLIVLGWRLTSSLQVAPHQIGAVMTILQTSLHFAVPLSRQQLHDFHA